MVRWYFCILLSLWGNGDCSDTILLFQMCLLRQNIHRGYFEFLMDLLNWNRKMTIDLQKRGGGGSDKSSDAS